MTTGWLLLLVLFVSSQSVDSQSTTDDETCSDGGPLSEMHYAKRHRKHYRVTAILYGQRTDNGRTDGIPENILPPPLNLQWWCQVINIILMHK